MRLGRFAFLLLTLPLAIGCTKQVRTKTKKVVRMGPMVFYARGGKVVRIEHLTPKQLFNRGADHYKRGKFAQAHKYYGQIVRYHKGSAFYQPALYNFALSLEKLQKFNEAAQVYAEVMKNVTDEESRRDAHFRLGASLSKAKRWPEAEKIYRVLYTLKKLKISDRLEVMARLGVTIHEQKRLLEAQDLFRRTISLYRRASRKEYLGNDYFTSMAHFRLGLIHDRKFRARKFRTKQSEMKADLNAKASDLLTAQAHYMRTIRLRNPEWVVAALFRVGDMYRTMYEDMLSAPTPKDLTKKEVTLYQRMLKKRIRILLTKANYAFERNIHAAQALGLQQNEWVEKTRKQMQHIRNRIIKEYYSEPTEPAKGSTKTSATQPASPATTKPAPNTATTARRPVPGPRPLAKPAKR